MITNVIKHDKVFMDESPCLSSSTPHATIQTHSTQAVVAHATPVHTVSQAAVTAAPAVASVGYAAAAPAVAAGYGKAAAPAAGYGYAALSRPPWWTLVEPRPR